MFSATIGPWITREPLICVLSPSDEICLMAVVTLGDQTCSRDWIGTAHDPISLHNAQAIDTKTEIIHLFFLFINFKHQIEILIFGQS